LEYQNTEINSGQVNALYRGNNLHKITLVLYDSGRNWESLVDCKQPKNSYVQRINAGQFMACCMSRHFVKHSCQYIPTKLGDHWRERERERESVWGWVCVCVCVCVHVREGGGQNLIYENFIKWAEIKK
jgi:hypothetical protein